MSDADQQSPGQEPESSRGRETVDPSAGTEEKSSRGGDTVESKSGLGAFWAELKRRKVMRVAIVYAVVSWLLAQVAITVFPHVGLPEWTPTLIIWILIIGFPIALIFAWAFEVTPEGIKVDSEVRVGGSVADASGHKLNYITLGLVVLVLTFLVVDRYLFSPDSTGAANGTISSKYSKSGGIKRSVITLEEGRKLALSELSPLGVARESVALSPNGQQVAFTIDIGGESQIYIRSMDSYETEPLVGTEGAFGLFYSPDSKWIGFLKKGKIMKVSVQGGAPQTLAEASNVYGASWSAGGTIVFAEREGVQLSSVSENGGEKQVLRGGMVRQPFFLPDGDGILMSQWLISQTDIVVYSLKTGETKTLVERATSPRYVPSGHIVYTSESGISAVPFDLQSYTVTGPRVPILHDVQRGQLGLSQLSFSDDGWLAYIPGANRMLTKPVWVDRSGTETDSGLPLKNYGPFSLSPDNNQVAVLINDPETDLWLYNFGEGTAPRRLTTGGKKGLSVVWSPDGNNVAYGTSRVVEEGDEVGIYQLHTEASNVRRWLTYDGIHISPTSWVMENVLVYMDLKEFSEDMDVWTLRLDQENDGPEPFATSPASEWGASMSPNGRYITYTSDESGQYQVHVKTYPPNEKKWTISDGYGEEPIWSALGDEIFYRKGNQWMSVPIQFVPEFQAGVPTLVFEGPYVNVPGVSYSVSSDSQQFLVLKQVEQQPATRINLVANWFEELERLAPANQ